MKLGWFYKLAPVIVGVSGVAFGPIPSSGAAPGVIRLLLAQAEQPTGEGTLNTIDAARRKLNITHGPVAALNWPGMTMDFAVGPSVDLTSLKAGSKIKFTLIRGADGLFVIDQIKPTE